MRATGATGTSGACRAPGRTTGTEMPRAWVLIAKLLLLLVYGAAVWASFRMLQAGVYVLFIDQGRLYAPVFQVDSLDEALALAVSIALVLSHGVFVCLAFWEAVRQCLAKAIRWFAAWRILLMGVLLFLTQLFHGPHGYVI